MYWEIYRNYLIDNRLDDDSNTLSVADLISFVNDNLEETLQDLRIKIIL